MQAYSDPKRAADPHALPDVETFHRSKQDELDFLRRAARFGNDLQGCVWQEGWYYWHCFPGCLPDSDPFGPFDTEQEALTAAQADSLDDDDDDDGLPGGTLSWDAGALLFIRAQQSAPGQGLNYSGGWIVAVDSGFSGGWDVYDSDKGSFYGFSVDVETTNNQGGTE